MITHKQLLSWMQEIHKDTLEYGNEDQQFVLEQMIDYLKTDYREGKPLTNNNIIGY